MKLYILLATLLVTPTLSDCETGGETPVDVTPTPTATNVSVLSDAERESLIFVRDEEKLARDVYIALDDYGNPFANIQNAEQTHMDAILTLLNTYNLEDPIEGLAHGEFANADLQALYGPLVEKGLSSEIEALEVGCEIEELDIRDIARDQAFVDQQDIYDTYDSLLKGSRNHLRAYYGKLIDQGGSYTPVYIDQATFDDIVNSPHE